MTNIAVITGGSSGLGYSLAELLGKQSYHIVLLARNKQRLDDAINKLKRKNYSANGIVCDITNENQVRETSEKLKADYGNINFLILNAGEVTTKLLYDYTSTTELKNDIDIDLWGTILSAYFFTPLLTKGSKCL